MLNQGDMLLVAHRRLFDGDEMRYFLGSVEAYEAGIVKLTGRTFLRDRGSGEFVRKPELATKLLSLSSGTLIAYLLPTDIQPDSLEFRTAGGRVSLTDGNRFIMNLTELPSSGSL